jgi:hypothetical protein
VILLDTALVIGVFSFMVLILADFILLLTYLLYWLYWLASMSPEGYSSQLSSEKFLSARNSPLIPSLLPSCLLNTVRALSIALRSPPKVAEQVENRRERVSRLLHCALLNARLLQQNMSIIQHHIVFHNLDLAAITEPWIREDSDDDILREVCSAGYFVSQQAEQRQARRGTCNHFS